MLEAALKTLLSLVLAAAATTYVRGWRRLRAAGYPPPFWRPASYALGVVFVAAALLSPLDELATERFSAHMAQHLLLTMMAAPLLLLGNPLPVVLWGLPHGPRRWLAAPFRRAAWPRSALSAMTFWPAAGHPRHQRRRRSDGRRRAHVERRAHVLAADPLDPLRNFTRRRTPARRRVDIVWRNPQG